MASKRGRCHPWGSEVERTKNQALIERTRQIRAQYCYPERQVDQSAGLDNVASVITELVEFIDANRLLLECERSPIAWVQRLGYLLDVTEHRDLADKLAPFVLAHAKAIAPLIRAKSRSGAPRDERWKLAVNATVEPDT